MKIFYDTALQQWRGFYPPIKPHEFIDEIEQYDIWQAYHEAYALAKENALLVGNPEVIKPVFWEEEAGIEYTWPHESEQREGKIWLQTDQQPPDKRNWN